MYLVHCTHQSEVSADGREKKKVIKFLHEFCPVIKLKCTNIHPNDTGATNKNAINFFSLKINNKIANGTTISA